MHPQSYNPVPQNSITLKDIPKITQLPANKMSECNKPMMRKWAQEHRKAVCKLTVRQKNTKHTTVLCKSNAHEFCRNSWLFGPFQRNFAPSDISAIFLRIFMTPVVLTRTKIRIIIRRARSAAANFRATFRPVDLYIYCKVRCESTVSKTHESLFLNASVKQSRNNFVAPGYNQHQRLK